MNIQERDNINRLFYLNITYLCNNNCLFCISHNTNSLTKKDTDLFLVKKILMEKIPFDKDIFIINGGEPTVIGKKLVDFVEYLSSLNFKTIVIYTNGRLLQNLAPLYWNRRLRIIVPLCGNQYLHNKLVNNQNAYQETVSNLEKYSSIFNISVKILISELLSKKEFTDTFSLTAGFTNRIILSYISNFYKLNYISSEKAVTMIKEEVNSKIKDSLHLEITNLPICKLFDVEKIPKKHFQEITIGDYYFIKDNWFYPINYNRDHCWNINCSSCKLHKYCTDNSIKYRVLNILNNDFWLGPE